MSSNGSSDSIADANTPISLRPIATVAPPPYNEQAQPRLKGRQRLIAGLQRISSSQSITRLNKTRSRGYSGNGKGSVSCISLHSTQSLNSPSVGQSLTMELAAGYSTAPTSAVNTPGIQIPSFDERARVRYLSSLDARTSAGLPTDVRPTTRSGLTPGIAEVDEDYFSRPIAKAKSRKPASDFNFWRDLPPELKMEILTYLQPRQIVHCSVVSKSWHKMCFDGQLWSNLDTADFYQDIPAEGLVKIMTSAGPFVRDLNLRGCVQLREQWHIFGLSHACRNVQNLSLEGCKADRTTIHNFLYSNHNLVHLNLSGLAGVTNSAMKILAQRCPKLEVLNVSWCNNVDTRGLKRIVEGCERLRDLRVGEVRGWDDVDVMQVLFERNTLERLVLMNCDSLTDESLKILMEGRDSEIDSTGRAVVPARKLKHLDLTRCRGITDQGLRSLVRNVPAIEGLQLSKCLGVKDATLTDLLPTVPNLTHLDLEELDDLTNEVLICLSASPCAKRLRHLSISYCEHMGDTGMLPLLHASTNLRSLEMDNTRISDLVLAAAASMLRARRPRIILPDDSAAPPFIPATGLRLVAYDCQNVTWTGVREVLSRNAEVFTTTHTTELPPLAKRADSASPSPATSASHLPSTPSQPRIHITRTSTYPAEIIHLKCFYTYQPTVEEHTKRVLRGDFTAARRLERRWAEFMIAQEEAGAAGAGGRRRRRRAREARMMHADEREDEGGFLGGTGAGGGGVGGTRRRARSGGCAVM
ncbi:hypothetical protein B0A50_01946 [Salinomyces thailandicus]|uniref:F-box domain-containing protein n=1 Tax=Salinomyces thailandicus TaxID=706561 RepID=A0A4U0U7A4_9PEZI|nr:hypothetical protein B0A50_01946 [Salinomyces thailandica]